jgi:hypothetical protein
MKFEVLIAMNIKIIIFLDARQCSLLWRIDLLLGGDSVDIGHCWVMPERNNGGDVTICDTYNCYCRVCTAYACMMMSHSNRRAVFSVPCGPCHDFIRETVWRRVFSVGSMPRKYKRVEFWSLSCRSTEEYELSVGDGHGKLVVEEELEVSLWRLSVWLKDFVTVTLF